ncbi:MAG TPA: hypothetical protein PKA55_05560 [Rhodoblastus sp.]|nr:hypothetical protein [Rhodoblastus sp.]
MNVTGKFFALGACVATLGVAGAHADALDDDYIRARNSYVARFDPGDREVDYKKIEAPHKAALSNLEGKLRRRLGDPMSRGARGQGRLNAMSLVKGDMEFGALDALVYPFDDKAQAYVSTSGIVAAWLKEHADWWDKGLENVPPQAEAALKFDGFYTQAISSDAAVTKFADLGVKTPDGAGFARAMLDRRQQDDGPGAPDEIIVGAIRGGRVYIVTAPAAPKPPVIAACEQVWKDYEERSETAQKRYSDSGLKDEAALKQSETLRTEGDRAFRACYGEKIKATPVYAKLVERAQALVERIGR